MLAFLAFAALWLISAVVVEILYREVRKMPRFEVSWRVSGLLEIEATNKLDAEAKVANLLFELGPTQLALSVSSVDVEA